MKTIKEQLHEAAKGVISATDKKAVVDPDQARKLQDAVKFLKGSPPV